MEYGILSIIPPIITIILAITTGQVVISLFLGIFFCNLILTDWNLITSLNHSLNGIVNVFSESWATKTLIFVFLIGGIMTLIQVSGGVEGFVDYLTKKKRIIKSRRGTMLLAYFIGIAVFIESSITILLAGTITRDLADKYKVSREKLAYICDSTSAPVCGLVPLNGWGATILGVLAAQVAVGVIDVNPVTILIKSIPYQVYSYITILSVFYFITSGNHFGPMKKAEDRAMQDGKVLADDARPVIEEDAIYLPIKEGTKPSMWHMILPILVLVVMVPISLYITGEGDITNGSGSTALFWAIFAVTIFTGAYYIGKGIMDLKEYMDYFYKGIGGMIPVSSILIFAFAIGNSINALGTGRYLANLLNAASINPAFTGVIVFILAGITAFATGTSFGTFAIMIPIALQTAVILDGNIYLAVGAAISGGIMGDHCSPISDTTIMSSMATASDHIHHVKTQIPYALLNAGISSIIFIILGYLN